MANGKFDEHYVVRAKALALAPGRIISQSPVGYLSIQEIKSAGLDLSLNTTDLLRVLGTLCFDTHKRLLQITQVLYGFSVPSLYSCVDQNPIHELNYKVHFICLLFGVLAR